MRPMFWMPEAKLLGQGPLAYSAVKLWASLKPTCARPTALVRHRPASAQGIARAEGATFGSLIHNPQRTRHYGMLVSGGFWRRGLRSISGQGGRDFQSRDLPAQSATDDVTQCYERDLTG